MHTLQFIHKDIKPGNVVWSNRSKRLMLVDFGVSCAIKEQLGFKTKTYR